MTRAILSQYASCAPASSVSMDQRYGIYTSQLTRHPTMLMLRVAHRVWSGLDLSRQFQIFRIGRVARVIAWYAALTAPEQPFEGGNVTRGLAWMRVGDFSLVKAFHLSHANGCWKPGGRLSARRIRGRERPDSPVASKTLSRRPRDSHRGHLLLPSCSFCSSGFKRRLRLALWTMAGKLPFSNSAV